MADSFVFCKSRKPKISPKKTKQEMEEGSGKALENFESNEIMNDPPSNNTFLDNDRFYAEAHQQVNG